jgi:hypothetical protein
MSPNFHHYSYSPHCQRQRDPLDSEDLPSTSRKVDGCQILFKNRKKIAPIAVVELIAFQHSEVLDVDDDTYEIISRYRDFSLERHEEYRHSSELVSESI